MSLTRKLAALLIVASTLVHADELKYIPKWKMCGDKACYEYEDAWKLVALDAEIGRLTRAETLHREIEQAFNTAANNLREALNVEKTTSSMLQGQNEKLNALLVKETTRADLAEKRPGPFPAWAIASGVSLGVGLIVGVVLGVYVAK